MIKIFVVLCSLASPANCNDVLVTSSDVDPTLTMASCQFEPKLAEWLQKSGLLLKYRFRGWKCQFGDKGRAA